MITILALVGVLVVLFVAAAAATHDGDLLVDAPADCADYGLPAVAVQPEDVADVRFGLALRGYRMAEVDEVLDRLAQELSSRNRQIASLQRAAEEHAAAGREPLEPVVAAAVVVPLVLVEPVVGAVRHEDDFPEVLPPEPVGEPGVATSVRLKEAAPAAAWSRPASDPPVDQPAPAKDRWAPSAAEVRDGESPVPPGSGGEHPSGV